MLSSVIRYDLFVVPFGAILNDTISKGGSFLPTRFLVPYFQSFPDSANGNCYCLTHMMRQAVPVWGCLLTKPFSADVCRLHL